MSLDEVFDLTRQATPCDQHLFEGADFATRLANRLVGMPKETVVVVVRFVRVAVVK